MFPSLRMRFLCQALWLYRDLVSPCNLTFILVISFLRYAAFTTSESFLPVSKGWPGDWSLQEMAWTILLQTEHGYLTSFGLHGVTSQKTVIFVFVWSWLLWKQIKNCFTSGLVIFLYRRLIYQATPWRHMREWRDSSTIFDLGTRWRWVVNFTPRPLYHREKRSLCPSDRRLDGSLSRSGRRGKEKNFLPLLGIEPRPFSP
jgi:hypothetical protein